MLQIGTIKQRPRTPGNYKFYQAITLGHSAQSADPPSFAKFFSMNHQILPSESNHISSFSIYVSKRAIQIKTYLVSGILGVYVISVLSFFGLHLN